MMKQQNENQTIWINAKPVFEHSDPDLVRIADNCDCGQCYCGGPLEGLDLAVSLGQHLAASVVAKAFGIGDDDD